MATIRSRSGTWQARVRRMGFPEESKSFTTKTEAQAWARSVEAAMDKGTHQPYTEARHLLLKDILRRYKAEVTPTKRGAQREGEGIDFMIRQKFTEHSMATLTPAIVAKYRDERLSKVSAGTIIRELSILSGVISHARREWGVPTPNPCALVRKPAAPQGRTRVLTADEERRLLDELRPVKRRSPLMIPLVTLALETAMRRGELLAMQWENIDLSAQTVELPLTKNGTARTVPLSRKAVAILKALQVSPRGPVFPISFMTMNNCFVHACKRAGIVDLRFHDLRHTATTTLATKLPNVIELAAVTGHQTIQMLKRYYHPKAEVLAQKLG